MPITIATVETKVATTAKVAVKPTIESSGDCQLRSAVEWSVKSARSTAEQGLAKPWTFDDGGSGGDADVDASATPVVWPPMTATDSAVPAAEPVGSTLESAVLASKPDPSISVVAYHNISDPAVDGTDDVESVDDLDGREVGGQVVHLPNLVPVPWAMESEIEI